MSRGPTSIPDPDDAPRFYRMDEIDPEIADRIRRHMGAPEFLRQAAAAEGRAALQYGIARGTLPGGAIAAVVREPGPSGARMIVVPEQTVTDRALSLARLALAEDEREAPEVESRRVLLVWNDQRVQGPAGEKKMEYRIPAAHRQDFVELLRARRSAEIQVPDVGPVQMVEVDP